MLSVSKRELKTRSSWPHTKRKLKTATMRILMTVKMEKRIWRSDRLGWSVLPRKRQKNREIRPRLVSSAISSQANP